MDKPTGKHTAVIKTAELAVEDHRIEANLEAARIAAKAADDERNDRRETIRTVLLGCAAILLGLVWTGAVVLLAIYGQTAGAVSIVALGVVAFAIAWGRGLSFAGFGFSATTGAKSDPLPPPPPPETP